MPKADWSLDPEVGARYGEADDRLAAIWRGIDPTTLAPWLAERS